ncbi:hypothetical protein, partial [Campylobacter troglodytis]|uniref:hypothetical protein n=1 Tax=Campylobacter troglodytis TaxID=654363 RepID=UPI001C8D7B41
LKSHLKANSSKISSVLVPSITVKSKSFFWQLAYERVERIKRKKSFCRKNFIGDPLCDKIKIFKQRTS